MMWDRGVLGNRSDAMSYMLVMVQVTPCDPKYPMAFASINLSCVTLSPFRELGTLQWSNVKWGHRDLEITTSELQAVYDGCNYDSLVVSPLPGNTFVEWLNGLCVKISQLVGKELASSPLKGDGRIKLKLKPSALVIGLESANDIRSGDIIQCLLRFGVYLREGEYGLIANVRSLTMVGQDLIQQAVDDGTLDFDMVKAGEASAAAGDRDVVQTGK
jgi:hypothetical protein